MQAPLQITLTNASLRYAEQTVFAGLHLELPAGQWTCLLGASGVGKTSVLRLVAGLHAEDCTGEVTASDGKPLAGRVAYMAQSDLLLPWASVLDNVVLGYRLRGKLSTSMVERARQILQEVGLGGKEQLKPRALSGGMRQRVALARTLLEDRPVVLMDEPFSALDAVTRHRLQNLAATMLKGRTVLLVTHDPLEALRLGHHIVILAGSPAQILRQIELPQTNTPRDVRDPELLRRQGELLQELVLAMEPVV